MFSSIRYKLLFFMIANIVFFALLLYGSNSIFAEKYYIQSKKRILHKSSNKIKDIIKNKEISTGEYEEAISFELNRLERRIGGVIAIGRLDGTIYYPENEDHNRPEKKENPFFLIDKELSKNIKPAEKKGRAPKMDITSWEMFDDKSFFIRLQDPHLKIETLRLQTDIGNGIILLVWVPMEQISESVSVSNTFTEIIALVSILITGSIGIFLSKTLTKPITEMSIVAKKMSDLDFSETVKVSGNDEIMELSKSINHLSQELSSKISELNIKNKQLENEIDHERKLDQIRKEFVSNVSHELKTPIFLIQGYAEGLKFNIAHNEEKRNFYCDVIIEESDKMDTLVKSLLDLSQLESGRFSINRVNFDITILLEDIIKKLETVFIIENIDLELITPKEFVVNADPVRIEQVIVNFLNNAINHLNDKRKIRITLKEENNKVKILVYNTGKHIPKDSLGKIWTSFYKVDKARTRECGGTGLGLSIVRAIQEAHKNNYGVANIEEGVEFWFDIDLVK